MKKLFTTLISAVALGTTLPALAGPDFQAIEQARKAKQVAQVERQADLRVAQGAARTGSLKCPPEPLVLPLDHGPRAQTTPAENRSRRSRYEAQVAACKEAAK
ncbi:hypothetical protein [Variovorax sp. RA8]|uniref:hypothetical protein n=1 Tax=Variovorax sp. (strain JCM 16519 / RA8) TaxID=662548 RepID=UPI0013194435|nr:hypothetical protein [Variovorax sp. RA8]VTU42380.1 hypothetical protein RA8P1_00220 [Variovorax sp. RA8]